LFSSGFGLRAVFGFRISDFGFALLLLTAAFFAARAPAQLLTQTLPLHSGWNSIWLEVTPTNTDVSVVFSGLPIESVWTFANRLTAVDFIQDPNEPVWNRDRWLVHVPTNRFESLNNNLFSVFGQRAYLVKLTNNAVLNVTGRPVLRDLGWVPDAYNLRGFPVNPARLPTFGAFFNASTAHSNQPIYRLDGGGAWQRVLASDLMEHGIAYWVFSRGGSSYQGPSRVHLESGDGLDFGRSLLESDLKVQNDYSRGLNVTVRDLTAATPLSYRVEGTNGDFSWRVLPSMLASNADTGAELLLRLGIRRKDFVSMQYSSLLEVADDVGTRWFLPVNAERLGVVASTGVNAGLWAGSATLTSVNEVHGTNALMPTPTKSEFDLRLLVHLDTNGQARFLKEVVQMWRDGTFRTNAQGLVEADTPGRFVLLTDSSRLGEFKGVTLRDGVLAGRRLSSAAFDFDGGANNFLAMSGGFGIGQTNSLAIHLDPNFRTNPFRHRYHPDHDNLDAHYAPISDPNHFESYPIDRQIELQFTGYDPAVFGTNRASSALNYGYVFIGGIYKETITGLHKRPIVASGYFRLNLTVNTGVLNQ